MYHKLEETHWICTHDYQTSLTLKSGSSKQCACTDTLQTNTRTYSHRHFCKRGCDYIDPDASLASLPIVLFPAWTLLFISSVMLVPLRTTGYTRYDLAVGPLVISIASIQHSSRGKACGRAWEGGRMMVKMQAGRAGVWKKSVCINVPGKRNKATKER